MKRSLAGIVLALRWPNLVIASLTLCLSYFVLLIPINEHEGLELHLLPGGFLLLLISTLLIMCGGYVINDWMDVENDLKNQKPVHLDAIPRKTILAWYLLFSLGGLGTSLLLCYQVHLLQLWSIQLTSVVLLLLYSTHLKSTPLAGNLIIAMLSGMVPLLPLIFDRLSYVFQYQPAFIVINFISLFAFLISLTRELVKDMEDYLGDKEVRLATFPIVFGIEAARWTAFIFLMLFKLLLLSIVYFAFGKDWISLTYLIVFVLLPSTYISFRLSRAHKKTDFHFISQSLKGIMLAGIGFGILYHFSYL